MMPISIITVALLFHEHGTNDCDGLEVLGLEQQKNALSCLTAAPASA